jgi:hypothetical protein
VAYPFVRLLRTYVCARLILLNEYDTAHLSARRHLCRAAPCRTTSARGFISMVSGTPHRGQAYPAHLLRPLAEYEATIGGGF